MTSASIQTRERNDGSTAYRVMFRLDGKLVGETFDDIGPAETFRDWVIRFGPAQARELRRRRSGLAADRGTPTVTEWVERHITALSGIEPGTKSDYRSYNRLSIAGTELGQLPVDVAQREDVGAWVDDLAETYSSKSIKNRHSLLSAAFGYAVEKKLRPDNPAKGQRIPESEGREPTFLTHGEFAIFHAHVTEPWRNLVAGMAGTGLRWGEITALRVGDLHLDDTPPTLTVVRSWKHTDGRGPRLGPPKSKKGKRTIGLNPSIVRVLRAQVDGMESGDLVFPNREGRQIRHNTFHEMVWTKALNAATRTTDDDGNEIPADRRIAKRPTPHDLRHSHASWLIATGVPLTEIQYRLGHESIKTTSDTYGHLVPGHLERSAAAIEIALAEALPELES